MSDLLVSAYPWIKSLHVVSVISWMAGLFYLPRLFVYHAERATPGSELDAAYQVMEFKLLKVIMNPAMIATWGFGVLLVVTPGIIDWSAAWPWIKLAAILGMTWFHMWCGARRKAFAAGTNTASGKRYRAMNEVPTVLMLFIVFAVIARPF